MSNSLIFALLLVGSWGVTNAGLLDGIGDALGGILPGGSKPSEPKPEVIPSEVKPGETAPTFKPGEKPAEPSGPKPADSGKDSGCPIGCPEGWVRFGFSEHCYKLPAQPAHLDTFWEQDHKCKQLEPTAYVAVMNGLGEQAVATPIAFQYAPNWFALATNGFMWLGGYTNEKGWRFLDGSDESSNLLMTAANIIGSRKNDTCLGADPKTLGMWQTRPCSDKTGAAICEMAPRRVCGKQGSILPITPIDLTQLGNLFPKLYSIPYIGQIFADSSLDGAISYVGNTINCLFGIGDCKGQGGNGPAATTPLPTGCRLDCPAGWFSWDRSPTSRCYYIAPQAQFDSMWPSEGRCRRMESSSHVTMVNTLTEQSTFTAVARQYGQKWQQQNPNGFLWLGIYSDQKQYYNLDDTDYSANILLAMANLNPRTPESFRGRNNTCVVADINDGGKWKTVSCNDKNGLAICEMPKRAVCNNLPGGEVVKYQPAELTVAELQKLFPRATNVPFLEYVLSGRQASFNPNQAQKNNASNTRYGDAVVNVICAKPGTSLISSVNSQPDWKWLKVNGRDATATGQWVKVSCKSGSIDAFQTSAVSYLSAWARCYNQGYEVAMPANSLLSDWYPFKVEEYLAEYYRKSTGSSIFDSFGTVGKLGGGFSKTSITRASEC